MPPSPFLLCILDGYALNPNPRANAVRLANTPCLNHLFATCPQTTLCSFGERVGLPPGQMGNSEVGHLNIGAGRVVRTSLAQIDKSIADNSLPAIAALQRTLAAVKQSQGVSQHKPALHLLGLVSEGGVHSQISHLQALVKAALEQGVERILVHAITDGRDCPPRAALAEISRCEEYFAQLRTAYPAAQLAWASVIGRYYAMDRDQRWERTELAYRLYSAAEGKSYPDIFSALQDNYAQGKSDEFIPPCHLLPPEELGRKAHLVKDDAVLFFNFRADRMRQIVAALLLPPTQFSFFGREIFAPAIALSSLTDYDKDFQIPVLFPPLVIRNHFGEVISRAGLRQLRIAETEKYAHVTYFFNGGVEEPVAGEERVLIPSRRDVATYDLAPQMSALEVSARLCAELRRGVHDVIVLNFANCDMVGHTGDLNAAIKAVETVDCELSKILCLLDDLNGRAIITADHGNADQMEDYETGEPHTFHTTHPVPFLLYGSASMAHRLRQGGALCDIAPTALELLGIAQPPEMTGETLLLIR